MKRDIEDEALSMTVGLFESGKDIHDVRIILRKRMEVCAKEIIEQQAIKLDTNAKQPGFWGRLHNLFLPPPPKPESADELIMRLIIHEFDIIVCAVDLVKEKEESQI